MRFGEEERRYEGSRIRSEGTGIRRETNKMIRRGGSDSERMG